jgi:V8-like Glu-specific endopeptidase
MAPELKLPLPDRERIVTALAEQAAAFVPGPTLYYRNLLARADLPRPWAMSLAGTWTGDPFVDARLLVQWALAKDVNPADHRYTTLGSLLSVLLEDQGLEAQSVTVAIIFVYRLVRDEGLLAGLAARYQIPVPAPAVQVGPPLGVSPEVELRDPPDRVELQGLLEQEPDFLDVGFLSRAVVCAAGICRVETTGGAPLGTGFLVGRRSVLTNCHVVARAPGEDLPERSRNLLLRFGSITSPDGREAMGQTYRTDGEQPLILSSPVAALDYALLRVEERITQAVDRRPILYKGRQRLARGMGLNLLGHPQGGPMKLSASGNGITGVYEDVGLVQYVTRTLNGSSGSPCFDDAWQPVALHHAERPQAYGAVREGILLEPIMSEVRDLLL